MSVLASWRTALRIARREARRSRGRSALVIAMIALPVLFLSFAAVSYDMLTLTGTEKADRTMGAAQARIQWPSHYPMMQAPDPYDGYGGQYGGAGVDGNTEDLEKPGTRTELLAALPVGSTALPLKRGTARVKTVDGIGEPDAVMVDATSPLTRGYVEVLSGRAPSAPSEVALTEEAMARIGAGIGGTVTDSENGRRYTVVGQVEFPSLLDEVVLFAPDPKQVPDLGAETDSSVKPGGFRVNEFAWLVQTPAPITWDQVVRLNEDGMIVASRAVYESPPPDAQVPLMVAQDRVDTEELAVIVLIAGLALLEIVLLAGPAFAVSARRRQRQLALVAANGGTPAHVRRIVLADGVVLGVVGAGFGIVAGIAAAFAGRPWVEELYAHARAGGYRVFPTALAGIAVLAVVTGVLAALVPAFITARQSVVAALAGRRGVSRSKKRWIAVGVAMIAIGGAITVAGTLQIDATVMLAGLILGELGLVLCTPALVGLIARMGRILPLTPRIALRDAARNRAAAAPAISAVMAAVAGSVAIGLFYDSRHAMYEETYRQDLPTGTVEAWLGHGDDPAESVPQATIERALRSTLPVSDVHPVSTVYCPVSATGTEVVGCRLEVVAVPELVCPQLKIMQEGQRQLTAEDRKAATADPRCDPRFLYFAGGSIVDDGTALGILTGATGDDLAQAQATLRAGGVVVRYPSLIKDGQVKVAAYAAVEMPEPISEGVAKPTQAPTDEPTRTLTVPGHLLTTGVMPGPSIVGPTLAARAGLTTEVSWLVAATTRMPTQKEEDQANAVLQQFGSGARIEHGLSTETDPRLLLLIGAAVAITLGAAAVGTGLAAADGRADLSTLAAVGASPRLRRGLSLSQSGVIAGLGSVLGALAGAGAAIAVITALNQQSDGWPDPSMLPIVVPWLSLLIALVIAPALAMLGAGLFTRSRLPIERRI